MKDRLNASLPLLVCTLHPGSQSHTSYLLNGVVGKGEEPRGHALNPKLGRAYVFCGKMTGHSANFLQKILGKLNLISGVYTQIMGINLAGNLVQNLGENVHNLVGFFSSFCNNKGSKIF